METNDLISTVVPTAHKSCYCLSLRPQLELLGITAWLLPSEVTLNQNPGEDLPRDEQVQKAAKLINACRIEALGLYSSDDLLYKEIFFHFWCGRSFCLNHNLYLAVSLHSASSPSRQQISSSSVKRSWGMCSSSSSSVPRINCTRCDGVSRKKIIQKDVCLS